jgi:hypothetical protein
MPHRPKRLDCQGPIEYSGKTLCCYNSLAQIEAIMEQKGRGRKCWANFPPVTHAENMPLARNLRTKRWAAHPFGSRAADEGCRHCARHLSRLERKEEPCDAAKQ